MADVNARIKLELVDGPAQKALADFVKSSNSADKAVSGLSGSLKKTKSGADSLGFSFKGFADIVKRDIGEQGSDSLGRFAALINGPMLLALGGLVTTGFALKKALDFTLLAERNEQISNSFNAIAQSAGLAGDSLREGLIAASRGLADDDDILRAANKSIIELGSNADRIPEIMEVARKSTALFGGDLVQNFENLSQALASGNTKALKNIGLVIDAESAQQKYAASIGVTVSQLTDAGKKQAITNAALEQAQDRFKDVDETSTKATQGLQRFKVSTVEFVDGFASAISQSKLFAGTFEFLSNAVDKASESITRNFGSGSDQLKIKLQDTRKEVEQYETRLVSLKERLGRSVGSEKEGVAASIEVLNQKLTLSKLTIEDTVKAIGRLSKSQLPDEKKPKDNQVDFEAVRKARLDSATKIAESERELARQTADFQIATVEDRLSRQEITETEAFALRAEAESARRIADQEADAARFVLENENLKANLDANLLNINDYYLQRDALANKFAADSLKRNADELKSKRKLEEEKEKLDKLQLKQTADTFGNLTVLMQTQSRELFAIGKAAALAQASINISEAITKAYAQTGFFGGPFAAAAVGIAGAVQIANIASQNPSFATGGIVPGNSFSGDRVQANVNSGEMVITRQQQANLFNQIKSGGGDSSRMESLLGAIYGAIESQPIVVNVGGKTVVDTLRSELRNGRSFE